MNRNGTPAKARFCAGTLSLLLVAVVASAHAETLREVFEKAWVISPAARTVEAKREEAAASRTVGESLFPGAPTVGAFQRTDRWNDNLGTRESEINVSVPLWLPGQKAARQTLAAADGEENQRAIAATRLAVAGELRQSLWTLYLARSEVESAAERLATALKLEADVGRRLKAGDIAYTDLLLAKQETASARAALADAEARMVRSRERYRVLTGSDTLPDDPQEAVMPAATGAAHPRLAAGLALVERARAGLQLARESRREAPSIGLQYRRDRELYGTPQRDSIGFAITIPLAVDVRNAPLIASASTSLTQAEAQYQRLVVEVEAEQREAEAQLGAASMAAEQAAERERAAAERLTLIQRSFALGESALVELLRAQSQATEARLELARSRTRLGAARANLNQARGIAL